MRSRGSFFPFPQLHPFCLLSFITVWSLTLALAAPSAMSPHRHLRAVPVGEAEAAAAAAAADEPAMPAGPPEGVNKRLYYY